MRISREFWRLFFFALAPQIAICILLWAFGLGSDTTFFNLVMVVYAPVSHLLLAMVGDSPSWASIGLLIIGVPLIGSILYSLVFAALVTALKRHAFPSGR